MMFRNRDDAAHRLAHCQGQYPLVPAVARGAVPIAKVIANAVNGKMDVVLVRKIGAPYNPEFAMGLIDRRLARYCGDTTPARVSNVHPISLSNLKGTLRGMPAMAPFLYSIDFFSLSARRADSWMVAAPT